MIKAIIFDCFGVLATEAWLPFKDKHFGHDQELFDHVTDLSHQANRGMISRDEVVKATSDLAGITPAQFLQATGGNVPNEELFAYIRELKTKYKIGFLSNISDDYLHKIFSPELLSIFDSITLSYKIGYIKPQAKAYIIAAQELGTKSNECIMVDDSQLNITGAKETGMQGVYYKDFNQFKTELKLLLAK